jgi:hypothetical protein
MVQARLFTRATASAAAIVVLLLSSLGAGILSAQSEEGLTGNGFRISPVVTPLVIEPGQSETFALTVENPTNLPITAVAVINNFSAGSNEDGEPLPILDESAPAPRNDIRQLIEPIENIELGPNEKVDFDVTVSVPADANAGGYYGLVRFEPDSVNNLGNVTLAASVGSLVLVRVPGDLTEQLVVEQISAAQGDSLKSFITSGDVSSLVRIKNTGDIHLQPIGKVIVKNMFGNVVYEYELNERRDSFVLPDSVRRFQNDLDYDGWFGRYTIEANISSETGGGNIVSTQANFWYVPVWAIVVLFVALFAIVFGIVTLVNRKKSGPRSKK